MLILTFAKKSATDEIITVLRESGPRFANHRAI
jgi:hypothetical protein